VNKTLDNEESDENCLQLKFRRANFFWVVGMSSVSIANFVVCFGDHTGSDNFIQNIMLIRCSKNRSLILATRRRKTHVFITSATTSTQLEFVRLNRNWCKEKHAQTCLYHG
jgi:hypothetical protein